ncbi:hypothetical protein Pcinc_028821 [Petrolisthes cinctipes]|uniref:C1q domain-containing protein n=1 Tax=Petrolisthes cinctipes TaxID=88211 RepID=A0AAE1K4V1_PETCI|nr:hypothetical protein Pcinc_028821 [Petrolisthes cinctipes]
MEGTYEKGRGSEDEWIEGTYEESRGREGCEGKMNERRRGGGAIYHEEGIIGMERDVGVREGKDSPYLSLVVEWWGFTIAAISIPKQRREEEGGSKVYKREAGRNDIHNTSHTTTVKMARLLLVTLVAVLGCQVSGQGDRTPVNFPVGGGNGGGLRRPVAFAPQGAPVPLPGPPFGRCYGGFSVRKARTGFGDTVSANTKIEFRDVLLNMGGWSPSFNDFEAPCSGSYYFSFHAVSSQSGDFTLQLYKNGRYQVTAYGSRRDFQQASNSALLFLQQGDLVHLQLEQGTIYEHPGNEAYTSFSGYLVESL